MGWVPLGVVGVAVLVATVTDLRSLRVFNWLTLPLFAIGLLYHSLMGRWDGFVESFSGALFVLLVLIVPYLLGVLGAGDVKLLVAVATWLGAGVTFAIGAVGLFAVAGYSLIVLTWRGQLGDAWLNLKIAIVRLSNLARLLACEDGYESVHEMAKSPEGRSRLVPFSGMLGFGMLLVIVWTCFSG